MFFSFFFFKQKTAFAVRISDLSSDVCSSDLCSESRWCACGCRDGLYGDATGTRCVVCGTQIVGAEITQPIEIIPQRQTTWGWRREKQERIRQQLEWERFWRGQ